jgi:hypothetical protein
VLGAGPDEGCEAEVDPGIEAVPAWPQAPEAAKKGVAPNSIAHKRSRAARHQRLAIGPLLHPNHLLNPNLLTIRLNSRYFAAVAAHPHRPTAKSLHCNRRMRKFPPLLASKKPGYNSIYYGEPCR